MPRKRKKEIKLSPEEERRKMESLMEQFLMLKSSRERTQEILNTNKVVENWRSQLRSAKLDELIEDIEILSQSFERIVDRKETVIQSLTENIRLAEEQHRRAVSGHLTGLNELIRLQQDHVNVLKDNFLTNKDDLETDFSTQEELLSNIHEDDMGNMGDMMYILESRISSIENEYKTNAQGKLDELKNKRMDERQQMKMQYEQRFEELWSNKQKLLAEYKQNTDVRKRKYEVLQIKNEKNVKLLDAQSAAIQNLNENIVSLKARIQQLTKEHREQRINLIEDREKLKAHYAKLKSRLKSIHEHHVQQLQHMTVTSNATIKTLGKQVEQVERLIRLGEICRKYELQDERILPIYRSTLVDDSAHEELNKPFEELQIPDLHAFRNMENFWKRFNKVKLDKICLEKDRIALVDENKILRESLKHCLQSVTLQEQGEANPLLLNQSLKLGNVIRKDGRIRILRPQTTVGEAALIFNSRQVPMMQVTHEVLSFYPSKLAQVS